VSISGRKNLRICGCLNHASVKREISRFLETDKQVSYHSKIKPNMEEVNNCTCSSFEGDLIASENMSAELSELRGYRWKNGQRLRIHFMGGEHATTAALVQATKNAIMQWQPSINLRLEFSTDTNSEIRISFKDDLFRSKYGNNALAVPVSEPTLFLGRVKFHTFPAAFFHGTVLHEFGHALGCIHEHLSPLAPKIPWIKDAVYNYFALPENGGWSHAMTDANFFKMFTSAQTNGKQFDHNSIMMYTIDKTWVTDPGFAVPTPTRLSPGDQSYIRSMYPKSLSYTLFLPGKQEGWIDTGIDLYAGQLVDIRATGSISFGPFGSWPFGPEGENKNAGDNAPGPGLKANSLVGFTGKNPIYVGASRRIKADSDSRLQLAANDDLTGDNDGGWNIQIEVLFD
jgi:serralysin